jgi:hypothetical protein
MGMRRITVAIDRLVLRGVDPADGRALVEALKGELARTLADSGSGLGRAGSHSIAVVRGAAPTLEPGRAGARQIGRAAARTIGKEIGR